ncbi:hypothetical protein TorRG33x02_049900, partial [Trema orientale]
AGERNFGEIHHSGGMSVLVTGVAGFVGTLVSLAMKKRGDVVVGKQVGLLPEISQPQPNGSTWDSANSSGAAVQEWLSSRELR